MAQSSRLYVGYLRWEEVKVKESYNIGTSISLVADAFLLAGSWD